MKWWFRQQLYVQILVAIVVGVALGLAFGDRVALIEPIGTLFIRLLKMLIVPLTFLTLISGITKLDSIHSLRSIGGLALLYYALSSLVAGTVGVCVALLIQPGRGTVIDRAGEATHEIAPFDFVDQLFSGSRRIRSRPLPLQTCCRLSSSPSWWGSHFCRWDPEAVAWLNWPTTARS